MIAVKFSVNSKIKNDFISTCYVSRELARDFGADIDIIIGGHTHSLLWNGPAPSGEEVAGTYPVIIQPTVDEKHNVC